MAEQTEVSQITQKLGKVDLTGNSQLFIGNLKPGTTQQDVYNFFSSQGLSVIFANVNISSKDVSNVFGNIKFGTEIDAKKAFDTLNGAELKGQKINLSWWNPGNSQNQKEEANVYVKDLDQSITQQELIEKFNEFGEILSVKLETFPDGTSKCFGYVQYRTSEEAKNAIENMDQTEWKGKTITVCIFKRKENREEKKVAKNNLYVRNFPKEFTEEDLTKLFSEHGEITSIAIKPYQDRKQAFICFSTGEQAQAALSALHGKQLDGCDEPLYVNEFMSKSERVEMNKKVYKKIKEQQLYKSLSQNLCVYGIPTDKTEKDIKEEFERFGPVTSIKMQMGKSPEDPSKQVFLGGAFVFFENPDHAKDAVYRGNIEQMFGTNITVDYYKPKEVSEKEKKEQVGVHMRKMLHSFMMTAMSQARGGFGGRGGRSYRGGRGPSNRGSYSGYSAHNPGYKAHSGYPSAPPTQSVGGYNPAAYPNPPLPGSGMPGANVPPVLPTTTTPPIATATGSIGGVLPGNPPVASQPPIATVPSGTIVSEADMADMNEEEKKQYIGEKIYPIIESLYSEEAPRITGMIIDMDQDELLPSLKSRTELEKLAKQGYDLLQESPAE